MREYYGVSVKSEPMELLRARQHTSREEKELHMKALRNMIVLGVGLLVVSVIPARAQYGDMGDALKKGAGDAAKEKLLKGAPAEAPVAAPAADKAAASAPVGEPKVAGAAADAPAAVDAPAAAGSAPAAAGDAPAAAGDAPAATGDAPAAAAAPAPAPATDGTAPDATGFIKKMIPKDLQ